MKKVISAILCLIMLLSMAACGGSTTPSTQDMTAAQAAKAWMNEQIKNNTLVSFLYDGKEYADHIKDWTKTVNETETGWDVKYERDGLELVITATYNEKHASLDWVGQWTNNGSENSKVISELYMIDSKFDVADAVLTTANRGGQNYIDDFQPLTYKLVDGEAVRKNNKGGRSTQDGWPYYDLTAGDGSHGVMLAIGWTGNWKSVFTKDGDAVRAQAGMQLVNYYMKPAETLRTPRMVVQFFDGDQDAGHNAWRQLVLDEYTPVDPSTGENLRHAFISINTWGGVGSADMLATMNQAKKSGQYFEFQWIDAGWYGDHVFRSTYESYWRDNLGNWYYNPGFPNGFEDIKAWHDENGSRLLVWFEPGLYEHEDGTIWCYMRTQLGCQWQMLSTDGGETWSVPRPNMLFTSPASPMLVKKVCGATVAVFNPIPNYYGRQKALWGRTPLVMLVSETDGVGHDLAAFPTSVMLEDDPTNNYCYPAILEGEDYFLLSYYHSNNTACPLNSLKIVKITIEKE